MVEKQFYTVSAFVWTVFNDVVAFMQYCVESLISYLIF